MKYTDSIVYLGVTINSTPTFGYSCKNALRNFYCSANSILNVTKKPSEEVLMKLLYTNCVPTLTYACAVKKFTSSEMNSCTVALNDAIRKIFSFNRWESVCFLRESFGYQSLTEIFAKASHNFLVSIANHENAILRQIYRVTL